MEGERQEMQAVEVGKARLRCSQEWGSSVDGLSSPPAGKPRPTEPTCSFGITPRLC